MQRVDLLLVELGFAKSRTHAQRLIKNGKVQANLKGQWQAITKPGLKVEANIGVSVYTGKNTDAHTLISAGLIPRRLRRKGF